MNPIPHLLLPCILTATLLLAANAPAQDLSSDLSLHKLLIEGQGWEPVAEGLGFADAPFSDHQGNFYYSDMRGDAPGIYRLSPDGKKTRLSEEPVSGLKLGSDGRIYACQGSKTRLIAIDLETGEITTLAEGVRPNDLVVTHKGHVYFTETPKKAVWFVNPKTGEKRVADEGITAPNGIALSPDQGTLAVSDVRGRHVWTFRIEPDGSLSAKTPYMTLRTAVDPTQKSPDGRSPVYKEISGGDGMGTDLQGRYYVSSHLGVQVFDPTGRQCGVLPNPGTKNMTSATIGGPGGEYLYVTCGDTIFRRQVKAKAFSAYQGPATALPVPLK